MAEKRIFVEGGTLTALSEAPAVRSGSESVWIEGGSVFIEGGGGGTTFQGEWDNGTIYAVGDMVTYNQNLYIATAGGAANTPGMNNSGVYAAMVEYSPVTPVNSEAGDIEIGIEFQVDQTCSANASLFYKGDSTNGGTHVGRIWNADTGVQLTSENYTGETASGWQRQVFSSPVTLNPTVRYIHSVTLPQAHYSNTAFLFRTGPFTDGPIKVGASLFHDTPGSMPNTIFNDTFYFNAVEVTVAANPQWQLIAKGVWGTTP